MSDLDFYRTVAGRRYYEQTLPELVRHLGRIADLLERNLTRLERLERHEAQPTEEAPK